MKTWLFKIGSVLTFVYLFLLMLGCDDYHLDKFEREVIPNDISLTKHNPSSQIKSSSGTLILGGNFYLINHMASPNVRTFSGEGKPGNQVITRCVNFSNYDFMSGSNLEKYYQIVGECSLSHNVIHTNSELICTGGSYGMVKRLSDSRFIKRGCFSVPYTCPFIKKSSWKKEKFILKLGEKILNGSITREGILPYQKLKIEDEAQNSLFMISGPNNLDVCSVALMKCSKYGELCWLIVRKLRSSKQWLVACNTQSQVIYCEELNTAGLIDYYFVDDKMISVNPFIVKVVDEHLACGESECLRKRSVESYFTIDTQP